MLLKLLLATFLLTFASCKNYKAPLIEKDLTDSAEIKNNLFVFVGEQLDFKQLPQDEGSMDAGFEATYKILQSVYGNYAAETITFKAYDHYGLPPFSKYRNCLLYISVLPDGCYQQKYIYNEVFLTKDGRWAGPYHQYDYDYMHGYDSSVSIKPEKIDFFKTVAYPRTIKSPNTGKKIEVSYPAPYYKTVGDSAIAVYGNYVKELFLLQKKGVLTARGLFTDKNVVAHTRAVEVELEHVPNYDKSDLSFIAFWKTIRTSMASGYPNKLSAITMDSVKVNGDSTISKAIFFSKLYPLYINRNLLSNLSDSTAVKLTWAEADTNSLKPAIKRRMIKYNRIYIFRQVEIQTTDPTKKKQWIIDLNFIETKKGYRFYGYDFIGEW